MMFDCAAGLLLLVLAITGLTNAYPAAYDMPLEPVDFESDFQDPTEKRYAFDEDLIAAEPQQDGLDYLPFDDQNELFMPASEQQELYDPEYMDQELVPEGFENDPQMYFPEEPEFDGLEPELLEASEQQEPATAMQQNAVETAPQEPEKPAPAAEQIKMDPHIVSNKVQIATPKPVDKLKNKRGQVEKAAFLQNHEDKHKT